MGPFVCVMFLPAVVLAAVFHLSAAAAEAQQGVRLDTPSGFPVPRFVSLKEDETNCRTGPSFDHPVRFVFKRAGAPVLVIAESVDHWRKIRDSEGDECWVHQTTLKAQSHVFIVEDAELRSSPTPNARSRGRIAAGALVRLLKRDDGWLRVSAGKLQGWIEASTVWGGDPGAAGPRN